VWFSPVSCYFIPHRTIFFSSLFSDSLNLCTSVGETKSHTHPNNKPVVLNVVIQCVPLATKTDVTLTSCQQQFLEKFGGRHPPSKSNIWALSKKLEAKGTLLDEHTGGRPKINTGFGSKWDTLYLC
jgi:hypothetical protein